MGLPPQTLGCFSTSDFYAKNEIYWPKTSHDRKNTEYGANFLYNIALSKTQA